MLSAGADAPPAVSGSGTIALRPAADPVSAALLAAWDGPLFSTSANLRGGAPPIDVARAVADLAGADAFGAIEVALASLGSADHAGLPSTIVDVTAIPPRLVRAGAIPADRLRATVPYLVEAPG